MKLLGSTKNKITKDKNGENVPHLEITEVVLVHYNIVNNDYQQDSRVFYTFFPNKSFGSLSEILPTNHFFFLSGFSFTDTDNSQDSRGREETILFHSTTSTRSRTFRHLFATLHVR